MTLPGRLLYWIVNRDKGEDDKTSKQKRSRLWLTIFLGVLAALAPLSTDMYLPGLPVMTAAFAVGPSLVQLTLTMTMAGMAVGQLAVGPISDQRGRRLPLIAGMLVFAGASLGCVLVGSISWFLAFRFVQGLAGAVGIVTARAIARDICEGAELTRFFALLMLVNGLAPILAPVIGGQLLLITSWRGIFVLLTVVGLLLVLAALAFHETLPPSQRIHDLTVSFQSFGQLLRDRYFLGPILPGPHFFSRMYTVFRPRSSVCCLAVLASRLLSAG